MTMDIERRFIDAAGIEIRRSNRDGKQAVIGGYAARFDMLSENLGGFREQIAPGAFGDCMRDDVRAFFNHDSNIILGRTAAGTLRMSQDKNGLAYEVDLPDTQQARDLLVAIERGDVSQSSFGFRIAPGGDSWDENSDGVIVRTVRKVGRLYDVSPVSIPAYPDATVGKRSLDSWLEQRNAALAERVRIQAQARARRLRLATA